MSGLPFLQDHDLGDEDEPVARCLCTHTEAEHAPDLGVCSRCHCVTFEYDCFL